jgi:predicted nucleotidyltransferase
MGIKNAEAKPSSSRPASTSMADALFSGTRQKILGFLFGQPETTFTLGELIERAQAGSGAVQREVARLVASGLVREEGKVRSRLYQANPDAPIFEELCGIARKLFGPEALIREALKPLQDRLQVALLYGSVAKGEDRAGSDIDVLIVSDELLLEDIYAALTEAERALGRQISPTIYNRDEFSQRRNANSPFLADVLGGDYRVLLGELV